MHPNRAFRVEGAAAALAFAAEHAFAHVFVGTADGPMVAHVPVVVKDGRLRFHVARANRIAPHLDGARALASIQSAHGYVSPTWYESRKDQVPTWNYSAVELEGPLRKLRDEELEDLHTLGREHEPGPDPWTPADVSEKTWSGLFGAIVGFELEPQACRTTFKLGQNRKPADLEGAIAGVERTGNPALAEAMRKARG